MSRAMPLLPSETSKPVTRQTLFFILTWVINEVGTMLEVLWRCMSAFTFYVCMYVCMYVYIYIYIYIYIYQQRLFSGFVQLPEQWFPFCILRKRGVKGGVSSRGLHVWLWQTDYIMFLTLITYQVLLLVLPSKTLTFGIYFLKRRHLKLLQQYVESTNSDTRYTATTSTSLNNPETNYYFILEWEICSLQTCFMYRVAYECTIQMSYV
jgi:hypothetical protein